MRSELDETIQHRIENIFEIFENDKRNLQSELTERIKKAQEKLQTADVSLDARTNNLEEELMKTGAAIEENKR
jgi:hypothetical protein